MKKTLVLFLTMVIFLAGGVLHAQAAIATQAATAQRDGIEVTLTTDKFEYEESEKINVTLEIVNTTDKDIAPVLVEYSIPNTCTIDSEGGSYAEKFDILKSGEKKTVTTTLSVVKPTVAEDMNLPSTGDGSNIFLWLMLAAASVFALSRMGRQNLKRLFAIVLCVSMMTSMLPVGTSRALAEEEIPEVEFRLAENSDKKVPPILDEELTEGEEGDFVADEFEVVERRHGEYADELKVETKAADTFDGIEVLPFEEDVRLSMEYADKANDDATDVSEKGIKDEVAAAAELSISGTFGVSQEISVLGNESEISVSISYGTSAVGLPAASFKTVSDDPLWYTRTAYTKDKYDKTIKSGVALPKSGHNYKENLDEVYRLKGGNGCYGMTILFDSKSRFEKNYDGLLVYNNDEELIIGSDGEPWKFTYNELSNLRLTVTGTTGLILRMLTDFSNNDYGFQVAKAIPHMMPQISTCQIVNGDGHVKLTWKKLFGYTGYSIERAEVSSSGTIGTYYRIYEEGNSKTTSYTDTETVRGKNYAYRIRQIYQGYGSNYYYGPLYSHPATISIPGRVAAPENIMVESLSSSKVKITWSPVSGATGYSVYSCKTYDGVYRLQKRVEKGNTATISAPRTGNLSHYFVCPYVKVGKFYFYGYDSDLIANFAIGVPGGVKGEKLTPGSYRVKWNKVANAHAYAIYGSNKKDSGYAPLVDTNGDYFITEGTAMDITGLANLKDDMYFRVSALRWDGDCVSESALSSPVHRPYTKYRALLIGNTYPEDSANKLPGPDNDVAAMINMLSRQTGTPFDIKYGINFNAASIKNAISTAFAGADSDDISLFYYSGHGAGNGSLCGTYRTYVTVSQLRSYLDKIPGKKIVLLDSCHSGAHINKSSTDEAAEAEAFNDAVIAAFADQTKGNLATSNYYVLTACSKKELSVSKWGGNFYYGLFTDGVTKGSGYNMVSEANCSWYADTNNNGAITLGEAYNYIVSNVNNKNGSQTTKYHGPTSATLWSK